MRRVAKIMTDDNSCFDSDKEAKKYLDEKYGNKLTSIAHKIAGLEKYSKILEFLDENIYAFEELIELKRELKNGVEEGWD